MKPLKLSLLIAIAFSTNTFAFFGKKTIHKYVPVNADITNPSDKKAMFLSDIAWKYPEIKSALENNRPIIFENLSSAEIKSLYKDMYEKGLIDVELLKKQGFYKNYKNESLELKDKFYKEFNSTNKLLDFRIFTEDQDLLARTAFLMMDAGFNSIKAYAGINTDMLDPRNSINLSQEDRKKLEGYWGYLLKLAEESEETRNLVTSALTSDGFEVTANTIEHDDFFKSIQSDTKKLHIIYNIITALSNSNLVEEFHDGNFFPYKDIGAILIDIAPMMSEAYLKANPASKLATHLDGGIKLLKNYKDAFSIGEELKERADKRSQMKRDEIVKYYTDLNQFLMDQKTINVFKYSLSRSEEKAREFYKLKIETSKINMRKDNDEIYGVGNEPLAPPKSPLSNLPSPTERIKDPLEVFGLKKAVVEKETTPSKNTFQPLPPRNTKTQNNRGQDLTPDKGVATVQPPQRPTQEYPVYQPSRPIGSNNDETRPPANKAPGPNEHGVVSTGEGSNGLVPAPSPSGSNIEPPHKAPDPDKTKELQAKIKNLKELRDSFIYNFKYSTDQINAAIKEKRVNDETINIANNANIDRKTALEFDKKVSELENEHARLVGDYQYFYRPIEIGDPININSLKNLISNQDKNRQTYQDLAEWGGIELDPEIASKLYSNDYLEKKYINGTPIKDLPTKGNAKYNGISDGKTVVKFQDTGETYDSYQFHSDFDLDVNFERQTVTPSFSNIETYNHKSPGANTGWGTTHRIFNKDETYSDIGISSFNGTAGFKGKAIPQNCKLYCQDEEYQFVGAFSGPDAQQVSGLYQGKGNFKDGVNNSRDIISETTGVFGAIRDNVHVPHVGVKESSGIITSYDSLSGWGGITLDDNFKNTLPTDYYAGQNNFHATVASEIPKTGTANYYGSAQMQRINSQNKNVMSNHTSDFEMSVDFQKQTVDSYFKNISSGAGLDHIYFEGVPIENYQHEILSEQQITGFRRENKSSKIVGAFVGPKAEKTVGMFEVEVNKDSQLQGTFHGDKQ